LAALLAHFDGREHYALACDFVEHVLQIWEGSHDERLVRVHAPDFTLRLVVSARRAWAAGEVDDAGLHRTWQYAAGELVVLTDYVGPPLATAPLLRAATAVLVAACTLVATRVDEPVSVRAARAASGARAARACAAVANGAEDGGASARLAEYAWQRWRALELLAETASM